MELTNIVYSSTLIILLLLSSLFVIGFLGSQYRKLQINFTDKRIPTSNKRYMYRAAAVSSEIFDPQKIHQSAVKIEDNNKFEFYEEEPVIRKKVRKISKPVKPTKPVSRRSLVREHYNSGSFSYTQKVKNKNTIKFN